MCYGLSFTLGFGVGSIGPNLAGRFDNYSLRYGILAGALTVTGMLALALWRWHGPDSPDTRTDLGEPSGIESP